MCIHYLSLGIVRQVEMNSSSTPTGWCGCSSSMLSPSCHTRWGPPPRAPPPPPVLPTHAFPSLPCRLYTWTLPKASSTRESGWTLAEWDIPDPSPFDSAHILLTFADMRREHSESRRDHGASAERSLQGHSTGQDPHSDQSRHRWTRGKASVSL